MTSLRDSLLNAETWLRILFILLFWVALTLIGWVLGSVVLVQALIVLCTGEINQKLASFAANLGIYLKQIVNYICFVEDEKPFPFSDFPSQSSVVRSD